MRGCPRLDRHPTSASATTSTTTDHFNPTNKDSIQMAGGKGKSSSADKSKGGAKSRSARAGLQFPVGRVHRLLRKGNYAQRVGAGAPVYLAPCSSTSPPKSSSWPATLPATTRRPASSPATCSSPSATTRSSTSCSATSPLPRAVCSPTSTRCCYPRRPRAASLATSPARSRRST
ncbi:histone-fold-containing protein, partial [Entophlyctis helioformis]